MAMRGVWMVQNERGNGSQIIQGLVGHSQA